MTPRTYRFLLVGSLVLGVVGAVFDILFPSALPSAFSQAQEAQDVSLSIATILFGGIAGLIILVGGIASTVGLYLFRPWAPRLALATTALGILVVPAFGAMALSGWAMAITELSSTLWGAVLAIAFFSSLSERFTRADR